MLNTPECKRRLEDIKSSGEIPQDVEISEILKVLTEFKDFGNIYDTFINFIESKDGIFNKISQRHKDIPERVVGKMLDEGRLMEEVEKAHAELKSDMGEIYNLFSNILRRLPSLSNFAQLIGRQLDSIGEWIERERPKSIRVGTDIALEDIVDTADDFRRYQERRRELMRVRWSR
ncbi:MAG: hypothetical protein AB1414_18445 [bacterium]